MGLNLNYKDGQTPIAEEEKEGLLIKTITSHRELDEHEQLNIESAVQWTIENNLTLDTILTEKLVKSIHRKMFGKVWLWAGKFRKTEKNIGSTWVNISTELNSLLNDTKFWITNKTYSADEIAIRFKHRLVQIHCFPNGNGRHSRLMADIIIESLFEKDVFSWSSSNLVEADLIRKKYITAIKQADNGNISALLKFARS